MAYWNSRKKTLNPRKGSGSIELTEALLPSPDIEFKTHSKFNPGPKRKLTLKQEFLLF